MKLNYSGMYTRNPSPRLPRSKFRFGFACTRIIPGLPAITTDVNGSTAITTMNSVTWLNEIAFARLAGTADNLMFILMFRPDYTCLLYTSPSPRDGLLSRMPSSA